MTSDNTKTEEQTKTTKKNPFKRMRAAHHGRNLHLFRERAGLSQTDLAKKIGKTQQYVSQLEQTDVIEPGVINVLAQALDIDPQYISDRTTDNSMNIFNIEKAEGSMVGVNNSEDKNEVHHHPIDKVCELYERMLNEKDTKNTELASIIKELKTEIGELKELIRK